MEPSEGVIWEETKDLPYVDNSRENETLWKHRINKSKWKCSCSLVLFARRLAFSQITLVIYANKNCKTTFISIFGKNKGMHNLCWVDKNTFLRLFVYCISEQTWLGGHR